MFQVEEHIIVANADEQESLLSTGDVLGGCRIIQILGTGAKSTVFMASSLVTEEIVALKVIRGVWETTTARRFQREAQICGRLSHPNIARVNQFGAEGDLNFLVMEYASGVPLDQWISLKGTLGPSDFLAVFRGVVSALSYAHDEQVLHRDIKPSNVIITFDTDGILSSKVVDFGLASLLDPVRAKEQFHTATGVVQGSPAYMSPEQCKAASLDPRSDIYSLGCAMYEALAGSPPFAAESPYTLMSKHIHEPASFPPDSVVNAQLQALVLRCLQKEPSHRFQSAGEILALLTEFDTGVLKPPVPRSRFTGKTFAGAGVATAVALVLVGIVGGAHRHPSRTNGGIPLPSRGVRVDARRNIGTASMSPRELLARSETMAAGSASSLMWRLRVCRQADAGTDHAFQLLCHTALMVAYRERQEVVQGLKQAEIVDRLITRYSDISAPQRFRSLLRTFECYGLSGENQRVLDGYQKAVELARMVEPQYSTTAMQVNDSMCSAAAGLKNFPLALEYARKALAFGRIACKRPVQSGHEEAISNVVDSTERLRLQIAYYALRLNKVDEYKKATAGLVFSCATDEKAIYLVDLGEELMKQGCPDEAANFLSQSCGMFDERESWCQEHYAKALFLLAKFRSERGQYGQACELCEHADALNRQEKRKWEDRGLIYSGDNSKKIAELKSILSSAPGETLKLAH